MSPPSSYQPPLMTAELKVACSMPTWTGLACSSSLAPALPSALQGLRSWPTCLGQLVPVPEEVRPYFRRAFSLNREKCGSQRIGGNDLPTFLAFLFLTPHAPLPHTSHPTIEWQNHPRNQLKFTTVELESRNFTLFATLGQPSATATISGRY